ncbi:MAG: DMT family transporter [Pseudobutyrivibrio sp.]|nr:DMT family transporter [Pseudobutyrivibrio sp.]
MSLKTRNQILLMITAIVWGLGFVVQAVGGEAFGAFAFNGIRNFMGSAVLLPLIAFRDKKGISKKPETVEEKKNLNKAAVICGFFMFLGSGLQQLSINLGADVAKAGFLTACYILLVPIVGIFFGRKCGLKIWIAVVIALVGLYLLCMMDGLKLELIDSLLLLCALSFAFQILAIDHFIEKVDGLRFASREFLWVGIFSTVPALFMDLKVFSGGFSDWLEVFGNGQAVLSVVFAGLCATGIGYTLQIIGQEGVNPTVASLIMSLESVFGALFGFLLLHQILTLRETLGCVIMFAAIILAQLPDRKA